MWMKRRHDGVGFLILAWQDGFCCRVDICFVLDTLRFPLSFSFCDITCEALLCMINYLSTLGWTWHFVVYNFALW